jgi:DNA replication protein DnaD
MIKILIHKMQNQLYVRGIAGLVECPIHKTKPKFLNDEEVSESLIYLNYDTCCKSQEDLMKKSLIKINQQTNYFFRDGKVNTPKDREFFGNDLKARIESLVCPHCGKSPTNTKIFLLQFGIRHEAEVCCMELVNMIGELIKDEIPVS